MQMKVTAGDMKGRRISTREVGKTSAFGPLRATGAKVRQAIFNVIGPAIEGASFVDLYSGTGAVGIEAMSRGAAQVMFVEADPGRAERIHELLCDCGCKLKSSIFNQKAQAFMRDAQKQGRTFDVIFLDPPYHTDELSVILPVLAEADVYTPEGVLLVEHVKKTVLPDELGPMHKWKTYSYGDTMITQYRRRDR